MDYTGCIIAVSWVVRLHANKSSRFQNRFADVFGAPETDDYRTNQALLALDGHNLVVPTSRYGLFYIGPFNTPSLGQLRQQAASMAMPGGGKGGLTFEHVVTSTGVQTMIADAQNADQVFQAASQFNCLEMIGPNVPPRAGIAIYANDPTQGPKCALACPAGTAFRNYLYSSASCAISGRPVVDVEALNQEVRVLRETIAAADTTRILQRQVELREQFPMGLASLLEPRTFGARWLKGGACAPSRVEYGDPRWLDIFSALASLQRDLVELAAVRVDDDDGDALRKLQLVWRVVPGSGERVKKHVSVDDIIAREVDRLASGANYLRSRKRSPSFKSALMVRRGVAVGPPDSCTQRFVGEADGAPVDDGYVTQLTIDFDRRVFKARGALEALAEEYSGRTSTTERKRLVIHMLGMLLDRVTELRQRFPDLTDSGLE